MDQYVLALKIFVEGKNINLDRFVSKTVSCQMR